MCFTYDLKFTQRKKYDLFITIVKVICVLNINVIKKIRLRLVFKTLNL